MNDRSAHRLKTMRWFINLLTFYQRYPFMKIIDSIDVEDASKVEMDARVQDLAKSFRITHILNKLPASISGGELQRAAIIRGSYQ